MPSAANAKSEKPPSSEATDNSPVRQIMTIIEHKIRNLEKRKSKLTSYRDLQKAGKELNGDQKVAVAKYDEVVQTLEFARDLSKQIASVATSAEREAKKQAKKEAWIRYTADTNKIREVLLILDCLMQMGNNEAREDFLNGTNGAVKLSEEDLKILDDLYPEVTPKHEANEEGQPGFAGFTMKAAEHLYAIVDGKHKEVLGTTYCHIKEVVSAVHACGYFDRLPGGEPAPPEPADEAPAEPEPLPAAELGYPTALPVPPAAAVVPAPAYPLRAMPPLTLQELEHAYFAQQYPPPAPRPLADVIGSQNFYFLQESEIDSPAATPAPPPHDPALAGPPAPIPSQTFTNQHFVAAPPDAPPPYYAPPSPPAPPPPATPPSPPPDAAWSEQGSARRGAGTGDGRYRRYAGRHNGFRGRTRPPNSDYPRAPRQYDGYRKDERHYNGDASTGERPAGAGPGAGSRGRGRGGRGTRPGPRHYARRPDRPPRSDRPE